MEKQRKQNLAVGLTTIAAFVGLGVLIALFGYIPGLLQDNYAVKIHLDDASGLHKGAHAQLSGIDVGKIEGVHFAPDGNGVIATARLRADIRLPQGTTAQVVSKSLLGGGAMISFQPPTRNKSSASGSIAYLPTDGSAVIEGSAGSLANQFTAQLQGVLAKPMKNIQRITDDFDKLTHTWNKFGQNLTQLTLPRNPAAVDRGKSKPNLTTVLARTDARLAQARDLLGSMQAIFGDPEFRTNLKQTVAQARDITGSLDQSLDRLKKRYVTLADRLSAVADSAGKVIAKLKKGKGTLGKLLNDSRLYDNLNDVSQRLQKMIDDGRLLIQKWKAEGLPVHF